MTTSCVLFRPELEAIQKNAQPRWKKATEVLCFPGSERKGSHTASKMASIQTTQLVLRPGVNMVSSEDWEKANAHPSSQSRIQYLQSTGAIDLVTSDVEEPIGASTDFTDLSIALKVVQSTFDKAWLELSVKRDSRKRVIDAAVARLEVLAETKKG